MSFILRFNVENMLPALEFRKLGYFKALVFIKF